MGEKCLRVLVRGVGDEVGGGVLRGDVGMWCGMVGWGFESGGIWSVFENIILERVAF